MAHGLNVVLTVKLAGMPSSGVDGVELVAYMEDVLLMIQSKDARLLVLVLGLYKVYG